LIAHFRDYGGKYFFESNQCNLIKILRFAYPDYNWNEQRLDEIQKESKPSGHWINSKVQRGRLIDQEL